MRYLKRYSGFFFLALFSRNNHARAQVTFRASAPNAVVKGEQFRLSYTLNKEGKDLRLPDLKGFEVLFGPSTSRSYSQTIVNGKSTSESSVTYTYILVGQEEGTFTIEPASITVDGSNYRSNSLTVKVLPPDKVTEGNQENDPGSPGSLRAEGGGVQMMLLSGRSFRRRTYTSGGFTVTSGCTTLNITNSGRSISRI